MCVLFCVETADILCCFLPSRAWIPAWRCFQVFVELNELTMDKNQEMQWKETARWIKFEEDVEEETDRWGKPHVASLSFRSLLELRRTISHGMWQASNYWWNCPRVSSTFCTELCLCVRVRTCPQVQCCWTWTRRPCLASLTRWWSRWLFPTRSKLRTVPTSWEPCYWNTGDLQQKTATNKQWLPLGGILSEHS